MWIKICGITRADDAVAAAEAGADAIGLVFADSPRRVSVEQARQIAAAVDARIPVVGVFVNADAQEILRLHRQLPLFATQLHGAWTPATLRSVAEAGMRPIPALRFGPDRAALTATARNAMDSGAQEILLDAAVPGKMGGTGVSFDWQAARLWTETFPETVRWIAAGGLTAENVGEAIQRLQPWGVDVSSGVEASAGIKSHAKIHAFVQSARTAGKGMAQAMEGKLA
jgi:phosphoribosylanthranilate isomerase